MSKRTKGKAAMRQRRTLSRISGSYRPKSTTIYPRRTQHKKQQINARNTIEQKRFERYICMRTGTENSSNSRSRLRAATLCEGSESTKLSSPVASGWKRRGSTASVTHAAAPHSSAERLVSEQISAASLTASVKVNKNN